MSTKKLLIAMALTGAIGNNANATILMDDWMLDVTGVDGINNTWVTGPNAGNDAGPVLTSPIAWMTFDNTFHTTIDLGADARLNTGDTFNVKANGTITDMFNTGGSGISPVGFNTNSLSYTGNILTGLVEHSGWELSYFFNINGVFSSDPSGSELNTNFDHTDGTLTFYVDNISDGTGVAATRDGTGIVDGEELATFNIVSDILTSNYGGVFSALLGNGGDKSLFALASNPYGAFKDKDGDALKVGSTLAFTNSDFQSNVPGTVVSAANAFQYTADAFSCEQRLDNFCGTESGQFRLGTVPEPSSLALLSISIFSFGMFKRRKSA